jgi:thiol-disulfide isomerase/thioredoxin
MIKKILLTAILLKYTLISYGGIIFPTKKTMTISGYISDTFLIKSNKGIELNFYNNFNENLTNDGELLTSPIRNNRFNISINASGKIGYYRIKNWPIMGLYQNVFLIQTEDSLCLNLKSENDIYFTGRGADKMNYQLWFAHQMDLNFKSFRSIDDVEKIYYNRKKTEKMISECLIYLNSIKDSMDESTYNLLKLNTINSIKWNSLLDITSFVESNNPSYLKELKKEIEILYENQLNSPIKDSFVLENSFLYYRYLFDLFKTKILLSEKTSGHEFEMMYDLINKNFKGLIRDKMLMYCFLDVKVGGNNAINFLPTIINTINDEESKRILQARIMARAPGAKAFNFSLETISGNTIKLEDLKGKVIVMDSWFLGCPGCLGLAQEMKPIIEYFKNNKNIVFLGVNVDKDKNKFIEGVKSGAYTTTETINVYTGGLGNLHPMLKFYQYIGYPNVLLIDKKGLVISSDIPRPLTGHNKEDFIKLIEKFL